MTNAERQKRYRDKKRGGAPKGRWPVNAIGHASVADIAKSLHISRTMIFMGSWIETYAPDVYADFIAERVKLTPTYRRLKREYDLGLVRAISDHDDTAGLRLVSYRRDGQFVFEWAAEGEK